MKAGKLNRRIILQKQVETPDGAGGFTAEWVTQATVWAEFEDPKLKTSEATGTIVSELLRGVKIRFRQDVCKGWRVVYGTKIFNIDHTYDIEREKTVLVCKELVK